MEFNLLNAKIPTLKQAESSFSRYRNPLNELHHKSDPNSFEQLQGEQHYPMQPYMLYATVPIYPILGEHKFDEQGNGHKFSQQEQKLRTEEDENQFKLNQTTFGCKKLCQIDCLLVDRYFNQKYWIFQNSNQIYKLDPTKTSNVDWLKDRLQHRYKQQIFEIFEEMIKEIQREGELQMNGRVEPIKLTTIKGFQNLERQIQKQHKASKKFDDFLLEIQQILAEFIFTSLQ